MTDNLDIWKALAAEFPRDQISWRAQSLTKAGDKALALAFIDARDVMNRLDEVVGPGNWSDSYEVHQNVTICTIAIRTPDGWVSKSDGAGDTDVEAEKGRLSDALKRAAVKWSIGRYLYAIPAPWVPCTTWTDQSGKTRWQAWAADPWEFVRTAPKVSAAPVIPLATSAAQGHWTVIASDLSACTTEKQLQGAFERHRQVFDLFPDNFQEEMREHYKLIRDTIRENGGKVIPEAPAEQVLTKEQKIAATP